MNFLLGQIPKEHLDDCEEHFTGTNGAQFYFRARLDEDGIFIEDTIGRFLPIDAAQFSCFAKMFANLADYVEAKEDMEKELLGILTHGSTEC